MLVRESKFISPGKLLLLIWLVEILLYGLHLIEYYIPLNIGTVCFLFGIILAVILAGVVSHPSKLPKKVVINDDNSQYAKERLDHITKKTTKYFIYGTIVNMIYSQGFPLLWVVAGSGKSYVDFGVPTFNGFVNSLYYISTILNLYMYLSTHDKKYIKMNLLLLIYPIITMTRALIFSMGFEFLGLYIMMRQVRVKTVMTIAACAIGVIILFGVIGNQRGGSEVSEASEKMVRELVDSKHVNTMTKLPSGFTWVYWYFTCSTNNLVYNMDKLQPSYLPENTLKRLLPSVLRSLLFEKKDYEDSYVFTMENTLVNTFTLYATYLTDFGPILTIVIFYFVGLLFYKIYYKARQGYLNNFLMYPAVIMIICLSVFDDFMLSLPTIFQLVITYYIFKPQKETNVAQEGIISSGV